MREQDRKKFKELASKRVNRAIKDIALIGNLSNKSNYDYTEDDINKIFKAIQDEVNACRKRFEMANKGRDEKIFSLD